MLHITNGDAAIRVMKRARLPGELLSWRDVLHEGPAPAGLTLHEMSQLRARFVAERGWAPLDRTLAEFHARDAQLDGFDAHEEVVLWFEHDLYDQLQLLQILDWFSEQSLGATRLSLMCIDEYLGLMSSERMAVLYPRRSPVTAEQLRLARTAWSAFCSPDPMSWQALGERDTSALPYLGAAVMRHLEQYPSVQNGTNRTENTLLNVVNGGIDAPVGIFAATQAYEESRFMGDTVFWDYLGAMTRSQPPLLEVANGGVFEAPDKRARERGEQRIAITDTGRQVLADEMDWVQINGIDKWLGGVHLETGNVWRWDSERKELSVL